jgi:uncharacterized protein
MIAAAEARVFHSDAGAHLFLTDGSRIYDLDAASAARIDAGLAAGDASVLADFIDGPRRIGPQPPAVPAWRAVSLNVAQACNMACGYCYADEGRFGGRPRLMDAEVARRTVDVLIAAAAPGESVTVGFMGGEPMLNRAVVHDTVRHAAARGDAAGVRVRFSITTNATLLAPEDAALFAAHDFTVTVSIDGDAAQNDAQRPMHGGGGSHARILRGLDMFARHGRPAHLSARITATAGMDLRAALDHLIGLGFDSVGFSAAFTARDPMLRVSGPAALAYRHAVLACGEHALAELRAGRRYPFSNLHVALQELHRGTHRPYPCGAGGAYLSADAAGGLHACHRLVDAPGFNMGDIASGPDDAKRAAHLAQRHVDRAEPCRTCWARYLCGGGCYQEVAAIGRTHCDAIRDWLAFCLRAYAELSVSQPEMFP